MYVHAYTHKKPRDFRDFSLMYITNESTDIKRDSALMLATEVSYALIYLMEGSAV
jgi:hypothetical protein